MISLNDFSDKWENKDEDKSTKTFPSEFLLK